MYHVSCCSCSVFLKTINWDQQNVRKCGTCGGTGTYVQVLPTPKEVLCSTCLGLGLKLNSCPKCENKRYLLTRIPKQAPIQLEQKVGPKTLIMLPLARHEQNPSYYLQVQGELLRVEFKNIEEDYFFQIEEYNVIIGFYSGEAQENYWLPHAKVVKISRINHPSPLLLKLARLPQQRST